MTTLQILLLAIAVSLDSLALSIVEGAMLPKIKLADLLKSGLFIGMWQTLSFILGLYLVPIAKQFGVIAYFSGSAYRLVSSVLFILLGFMMLRKSLKKEVINEKMQTVIADRRIVQIALLTSVDAVIAGLGLSLTGTQLSMEFFLFFVVSVLSVITGVFIGYWFGYEQKPKAYRMSSIIFFVCGSYMFLMA